MLNDSVENWFSSTLIFISFASVSISSDPPFLKFCVSPLYANVFANRVQNFQPLGQSEFISSEYYMTANSHACGLKTSISRILLLCVLTRLQKRRSFIIKVGLVLSVRTALESHTIVRTYLNTQKYANIRELKQRRF